LAVGNVGGVCRDTTAGRGGVEKWRNCAGRKDGWKCRQEIRMMENEGSNE
jgi:hypothetical protein